MSLRNSRIIIVLYFLGYIVVFPFLLLLLINSNLTIENNSKIIIEAIYYCLFFFIIVYLGKDELKKAFYIIKFKTAEIFKSAFVRYLGMILSLLILNSIIMKFNPNQSLNEISINELLKEHTVFIFLLAVVFAPVIEELVFRGAIFAKLYKQHRNLAFAISSLLFGFIHVSDSLFMGNYIDLLYIISYGSLGFLLCLGYEKYDNVGLPILMHFLNNLISMLLTFLVMS